MKSIFSPASPVKKFFSACKRAIYGRALQQAVIPFEKMLAFSRGYRCALS
jgi:hypothetical protein